MRIADKMAYNQVNSNLGQKRQELAHLQNQAATQKRVTKPSDDPLAASRVLSARTEIRGIEQFTKNINQARSFLEYSDQSLGELSEALVRAKELAIYQANDAGATEDSRRATATEVEQILSQSVQIGNRRLGDRYIFAGHRTTQAPFDRFGQYHGDDGEIRIQINKDAAVSMNLPGNQVFLGRGLGPDGAPAPRPDSPESADDLRQYRLTLQQRRSDEEALSQSALVPGYRSPAAAESTDGRQWTSTWVGRGVNVFSTLQNLETSLRTNDKEGIQDSLDLLDEAIGQIILARSQVGSRVMALDSAMESLHKAKVDRQVMASELEDADLFQVVSDITKTDSAMRATLETSSRLIQPSLLDFLR